MRARISETRKTQIFVIKTICHHHRVTTYSIINFDSTATTGSSSCVCWVLWRRLPLWLIWGGILNIFPRNEMKIRMISSIFLHLLPVPRVSWSHRIATFESLDFLGSLIKSSIIFIGRSPHMFVYSYIYQVRARSPIFLRESVWMWI